MLLRTLLRRCPSSSSFQLQSTLTPSRNFTLSATFLKAKDGQYNQLVNKHNQRSSKPNEERKKKQQQLKSMGSIDVWRYITVQELADTMKRNLEHVQEAMLYVKGADNIEPNAKLNDLRIIRDIATKCGFKVRTVPTPTKEEDETDALDKDVFPRPPAPLENLKPRPPVITVMGHVDHGKTTLLDTLRGAHVAEGEAGGITQHIGAFTVTLDGGEKVTFLDTPGHAAFSSMRARGAHCTDIIVLVVAAEDGVMQQTREVIELAKEGKVPLIVAINKIDAPGADIEKTKRSLLHAGVPLDGFGGEVQYVPISALHGTNLETLCETISLQASIMELKSEYVGPVEGIVIESKTDHHRGKLSTSIITRGTLRKGSILIGGHAFAKVRAIFDHENRPIEVATPGMPVEILGWRELPLAGDVILEVENEKKAHSVIHFRDRQAMKEKAAGELQAIREKQQEHLSKYQKDRQERLLRRQLGIRQKPKFKREKTYADDDTTPKLDLIIKGDVHGSVEAILDVLDTYNCSDKCRLSIVHYGVGEITENDIELARTFNALIYAFSIQLPSKRPQNIKMREFNVIYRMIEELTEEINKILPEIDVEVDVGEAKVLQIFHVNDKKKKLTVLGCRCTKGTLKKSYDFKLLRDGVEISNGKLVSMRHLKNEVESIKTNVECGLQLDDQDVEPKEGDTVLCYTWKKEKQNIDWDPGF